MPFSVDVTNPADNSIVSAFPANERSHRSNFKAMWIVEHEEASGRHVIPNGTIAARDAITDWPNGALFLRNQANLFPGLQQRRGGAWVDVLPYGVGTTATRDAQTTVPTGALWANTERGAMERYTGAAWSTLLEYGVGNAAARVAFATPYTNMLWYETDTRSIYYYSGAWTLIGVLGIASSVSLLGGTQAARPTAAGIGAGNFYGNTDDLILQRSDGAAWLDLFPPQALSKSETTYTGQTYTAAMAYVLQSLGVDMQLQITTPARGNWRIFVVGNVVASSGVANARGLSCELHRGGVRVGTGGGSAQPNNNPVALGAIALDIFTAPANSTTYTYKLRAMSDLNNSTSVEAGIYAAMIRVP